MNKIIYPLRSRMQGAEVVNLQSALQLLLDRGLILPRDEAARREASAALLRERAAQTYGDTTQKLVGIFQRDRRLDGGGDVDEQTANALNRLLDELGASQRSQSQFVVKGKIRLSDNSPADRVKVSAFDRDLRAEELLGRTETDRQGAYQITYATRQFLKAERGTADIVVKVYAADGSVVATSPTLFNAPAVAEIDLTIPVEDLKPPTLFERIARELPPLIGEVKVEDLDENKEHQDISFLSGETGFEKKDLARFVLAARLAPEAVQPEFWFVLLGGSFYEFAEGRNLKEQLTGVQDVLLSFDASSVRTTLARGFDRKEISARFRDSVNEWVKKYLEFTARRMVSGTGEPGFVKLALDHAGIGDAKKQEWFARLFTEHQGLTPELLKALDKDAAFSKAQIADVRTSFQLADLTRGDFTVVKAIQDEFKIRDPGKIRTLAKNDEKDWVKLVKTRHAAGQLNLPIKEIAIAGAAKLPAAEVYGKVLERRFREPFPTTAFAGGLERALKLKNTRGLRKPDVLRRFLDQHERFELLTTPVDQFLRANVEKEFRALSKDEAFRFELKSIQRVFKLAPNFEATNALLTDGLHSAQKVYRMGKTQF